MLLITLSLVQLFKRSKPAIFHERYGIDKLFFIVLLKTVFQFPVHVDLLITHLRNLEWVFPYDQFKMGDSKNATNSRIQCSVQIAFHFWNCSCSILLTLQLLKEYSFCSVVDHWRAKHLKIQGLILCRIESYSLLVLYS